MDYQKLKELQQGIFNRCLELTEKKGNDYSKGNKDVLRIFRESADELGISMFQAIGLFMKKHTNAIFHYMKTGGQSESEPIRERVVDAINYLTFLLAAIDDEENNKKPTGMPYKNAGVTELEKAIENMRKRQDEQGKQQVPNTNPWMTEPWIQPHVKRYEVPTHQDVWKPSTISYTLKKDL